MVSIQPDTTQFLITNLEVGTYYHVYVEAVFENKIDKTNLATLRSWILIAKTRGYGPNNCKFHQLVMSVFG